MSNFEIGDKVYAGDWFYGTIVHINGDIAFCEFETDRGGGTLIFGLEELRRANDEQAD